MESQFRRQVRRPVAYSSFLFIGKPLLGSTQLQEQQDYCYEKLKQLQATIDELRAEKDKAILEERERGAKIVENFFIMEENKDYAEAIANEIRKGDI